MKISRSAVLVALFALPAWACKGTIQDSATLTDGGMPAASPDASFDAGVERVTSQVNVTPARLTLRVGETSPLTAQAVDQLGAPRPDRPVTWMSSDDAVATVQNGVVTAVASGTATVTATIDEVAGTAIIEVSNDIPTVVSVEVLPAAAQLVVGQSIRLSATARDGDGNVVGRPVSAWTSSDDAIATVNATGVVAGVAPGSAVISATVDDVTGSTTIEVTPPPEAIISVDPAQTFQTMIGIEAASAIGQLECLLQNPIAYNNYKGEVIRRAVDELGIDRIRLEFRNGYEKTLDGYDQTLNRGAPLSVWIENLYTAVNDNNDPNVTDPNGFRWTEIDHAVTEVVNPLRDRLRAQGRSLYVNLCTVAFSDSFNRSDPDEFAELVVTTFRHLRDAFGWVPDGFEVLLEPDTAVMPFDQYAANMVAAKQRLNAAGFTPDIIGPSHANMSIALEWYDRLQNNAATRGLIDELAYHRYGGVTQQVLREIGQRRTQDNIRTGMLEHIGSDHFDYEADLVTGGASAWQLLALAFCEGDNGGDFFYADMSNAQNPVVRYSANARYLPQYSRTVHRGAVRHGASSSRDNLTPYAFRNPDGRWTVVVRSDFADTFTIGGVPPGTYRVFYTTDTQLLADDDPQTIAVGEVMQVSIPAGGVITVHQTSN